MSPTSPATHLSVTLFLIIHLVHGGVHTLDISIRRVPILQLPFFPSETTSASTSSFTAANISSLILLHSSSPQSIPTKFLAAAIAIPLAVLLLLSIAFFFYLRSLRRRRRDAASAAGDKLVPASENVARAFHPDVPPAPSVSLPTFMEERSPSHTRSEFLYPDTLVGTKRSAACRAPATEINLLTKSSGSGVPTDAGGGALEEEEREEFYTPRGFASGRHSFSEDESSSRRLFSVDDHIQYCPTNVYSPDRSASVCVSPAASTSTGRWNTKSPELDAMQGPPSPLPPLYSSSLWLSYASPSNRMPSPVESPRLSTLSSINRKLSPAAAHRNIHYPALPTGWTTDSSSPESRFWDSWSSNTSPRISSPGGESSTVDWPSGEGVADGSACPPPPPPLPPLIRRSLGQFSPPPASEPKMAETTSLKPPLLVEDQAVHTDEIKPRPKLKPLHWDKVRASSGTEMVWDHLGSSSFRVNEEMIETLFIVDGKRSNSKETSRRKVVPSAKQETRVLDPKKAQNVAILLRGVSMTREEVCEALLEGNACTLGTELLESLSKMAPTKEEERKLKEYQDDSPDKLGHAEIFLKSVLDVPFAFKRVEAMLYVANFDSELQYLNKSFESLKASCDELRNSRMFLKLLEAVLKTGNRMNLGTDRGDAHAFTLDTLLKLVDIKGVDGKTTLLHFVVQEVTRYEGARITKTNQTANSFDKDSNCRKLGLQIVSGLSSELSNVKKAAAMDSDVLSNDVAKLSRGLAKVGEVVRLNEAAGSQHNNRRFSESMNRFMKMAEEEIRKIKAQETVALSQVMDITQYFHGNSAKEEAHPFRIFMVVRDFLRILDRVCKDVGVINERMAVSASSPEVPTTSQGFAGF